MTIEQSWLDGWLAANEAALIAYRRHIHAHPELGRAEHATTTLVEAALRQRGLTPQRLAGGTGLVCDIASAHDGPTVALRADLDALPVHDAKDVSYRSTVDGVCHACGHDVHTAVLLGAALALVDGGGPPRGVVRLVFQPAEELIPGGALDVIATGAIDDVDVMVALHCAPTLDAGLVGLRDGVITAASDAVEIRLTGPGGHTARPELTVDLVAALAKLAVGLPPALASHGAPDRPLALVWGAINAGAAGNVIPASGALRGSVRTMDGRLWDQAEGLLRQAVDATLAGTGARAEVDYRRGVPPVVNDPAVVDLFRAGVVEMVGPLAVAATEPSMGGEDFGWYLQRVPGALARLGVRRPGEAAGDLHRAGFDVDEAAIAVGVRTLVGTALAALTPTLTGTGREPGISPPS